MASKMNKFRNKIKENPIAEAEMKKKHAEEMKKHRKKWTESQKERNRELSKLRMKKMREKKKKMLEEMHSSDQNETASLPETRQQRKDKEEQKQKQREYKRQWRANLSSQKKRRIREKDATAKRLKRKKTPGIAMRFPAKSTTETGKETGFSYNETALRKAVYRTKKQIPKSPTKYAKVVKKLLKQATPRKRAALENEGICSPSSKKNLTEMFKTVKTIHEGLKGKTKIEKKKRKEFLRNFSERLSQKPDFQKTFCAATGIKKKYLSHEFVCPKPAKIRKDALAPATKGSIVEFFKKETNAVTVSDKKAIKKDLREKHVLTTSQKSLWNRWNEENPDEKLSFSKFCTLRPKNVLTQGYRKLYQCLCEYCENLKLKLVAINKYLTMKDHAELKLYDEFDAVNKTLCPKGEDKKYHRRDCIDRKCALFGTAILKTQLKDVIEINNQEEIKWSKWEVVKTFNRKTNKEVSKRQEVLKSGTPEELIDEIANELDFLSIHLFEARWQQDQFSQLSKEFPEKSVVMTIDFAENYTCFSQNEIQGAHWAKDSVTIHPCVVLYRCPNDGEIVDECVDIVSDDLCHDSHAVNFFTKSVMKHLKEERQLEIDHAYIISDGCAGQYKSKVPLMDASCSKEDLGCTVERCYYGSRHGKNRCDGEAGVLKAKGTRAVKNGEAIIYDAKSFYNCVKSLEKGPAGETECKHKRRTILWVDSTAINRKRDDRNVKTVKGTRKLHSVLGEQRGTIRTRRLSCFCEQCICFRYDRCTNTGHVEMWKTVFLKSIQQKVVEDQDDLDHDAEGIVLDAVVADDEDGMLIRQNADENDIVADHNVENHEQAPVEGVDLLEAGGSDDLFNVGELQDLSYDANTSFSYIKDVDDIGFAPGNYVLVKHGSVSIPAVITRNATDNKQDEKFIYINFFKNISKDHWTINSEEFSLLKTDILRKINEPELVLIGSRCYCKFVL